MENSREKRYIIKAVARRKDYVAKGLEKNGYIIITPYKDNNIFCRIIREIWFRLHLPKTCWFNKEIESIHADHILIYDALIVPEFIEWICKIHKDSSIEVHFNNRVDALPLKPTVRLSNLTYSSYDKDDCQRFDMKYTPAGYLDSYCFSESEKKEPEYDVIYLGRDKGRAESILELQKQFEAMGLKTYFHITADRDIIFLKHKKAFYKPIMPYEDYIELLKKTRAHLNYVQKGQTSVSQRDMETVFDSVKCITNNKGIKAFELYDPTRFFILGEDDLNLLPNFLETPFLPVPKDLLDKYRTR